MLEARVNVPNIKRISENTGMWNYRENVLKYRLCAGL